MFWIRLFAIPLLLTVVVEEIGALLWGARSLQDLLAILWINVITNLPVTALRYLSGQILPAPGWRTAIVILLELMVIWAEWKLFRRFLHSNRHSFLTSVTLNAASYGAGLLLPVILALL